MTRVMYGLHQHQFDLSSRPLLELALKDAAPAFAVKVEWLADSIVDGQIKHRVLTNYQQILRRPFSPKPHETFDEAAKRAGELFLDDVEKVLWYGKPSYAVDAQFPLSMCGGVLHYLGRRLYENDTVRLRPLSDLMLRDFRDFAYVGAEGEWLWEFSLQVTPGHYERGMKPICLPPNPGDAPKAWAQGASLEEELITT